MLLTIHNLPSHVGYSDIKSLIKEKCGLKELILDNLVSEGKNKRVTVGLADEGDAVLLVRKLNGFFLHGLQLYVEDLRPKKQSDQPYRPSNLLQENQSTDMQQKSQFVNQRQMVPAPLQPPPMMSMPPNFSNMPFYMSPVQTTHVNYNKQAPPPMNAVQQVPFYQQSISNYPYQQSDIQNQFSGQAITSYPDKSLSSANNALNMTDNRNLNRTGVVGGDAFNIGVSQEVRRSDKNTFGTPKDNRDFRGQDHGKMDGKKFRSKRFKEQEDKFRHQESTSGTHDRFGNRSKPNARRGNDFDNSKHSRFDRPTPRDRSPPRNRSRQHNRSPPRDRSPPRRRSPPRGRSPPRDRSPPHNRFRRRDGREQPINQPHKPDNFYEQQQRESFDNSGTVQNFNQQYINVDEFEGNNGQDANRQINIGSNRPKPNRFETYGNNPNNSTFSKSSNNTFGQKAGFAMRGKKRDGNFAHNFGPPSKITRFKVDRRNVEFPSAGVSGANSFTPPEDLTIKEKLMKYGSWRRNSAKFLACEVVANAKVGKMKNFPALLTNLKKCIASRIDVIIGDEVVNSLKEMIDRYRAKFNVDDDVGFYKAVLEKMKRDKDESAGPGQIPDEPIPGTSPQKYLSPAVRRKVLNKNGRSRKRLSRIANQELYEAEVGADETESPSGLTSYGKLPKYPNANKQEYKDQKKTQKMEFQAEDMSTMYTMDSVLQSAIDNEIEELANVFVNACDDESTDINEVAMREKLAKNIVKDFKKVIKVHTTRRVLNVKSNLIVRIYLSPKSTKQAVFEPFLRSEGVITLKKSDKNKMYLATCGSYESFDKLVALGLVRIGDVSLRIKPLYLVGPPDKKMNRPQQTVPNQWVSKDYGNDESLVPESVDVAEDADASDEDPAVNDDTCLDDEDVVVLEGKNEVVVIEDNIHTEHANVESKADDNASNDENLNINEKTEDENAEVESKANDNVQNDEHSNINDKTEIENAEVESKANDNVQNDEHSNINDKTEVENAEIESKANDNAPNAEHFSIEEKPKDNSLTSLDNEGKTTSIVKANNEQPGKNNVKQINENPSVKNKIDEDILESVDVVEDDLEDF